MLAASSSWPTLAAPGSWRLSVNRDSGGEGDGALSSAAAGARQDRKEERVMECGMQADVADFVVGAGAGVNRKLDVFSEVGLRTADLATGVAQTVERMAYAQAE